MKIVKSDVRTSTSELWQLQCDQTFSFETRSLTHLDQKSNQIKSLPAPIMGLYLLDYGAGNVQSLANALKKLGHDFQWISQPSDFAKATVRPPFFLLGLKNIEYSLFFFSFVRVSSFLASVLLKPPSNT